MATWRIFKERWKTRQRSRKQEMEHFFTPATHTAKGKTTHCTQPLQWAAQPCNKPSRSGGNPAETNPRRSTHTCPAITRGHFLIGATRHVGQQGIMMTHRIIFWLRSKAPKRSDRGIHTFRRTLNCDT